ncbi:MAG: glycosyltransferase family 2 protein [Patescibacteria group bacterium]
MKISIITVSYNSAATIEDTIESVLSQSYKDIEYIIIDGGSTDGTLEIINKYKGKIAKFISEPDKGLYDAMNKGIKLTTGAIIGTLNSDDVYADEKVIELVVENMKIKEADVLWGNLIYVDKFNLNKIIRYWKSSNYQEAKFKIGWHPPHPTFFVKKSIYEKYGVFNLDFKIAADYELMLRFLEKYKIKSCYFDKVLVKMREGGISNKSIYNIIKANIEVANAWKINNLKGGILASFLKPVLKISQFFKSK